MPEIGANVKRNMKDRWEATKQLAKDEVDVFKNAFQDVKGRLINAKEPTMGREYNVGAAHGKRGGLVSTVASIPVGIIDGVEKFLQKQGEISRRWIK